MEFLELASERYSVRKFKNTPVPQEVIEKIIKAGLLAPTACNNQPQKIIVVKSAEGLAALKTCTTCHFDAPLALIICNDKNLCWKRPFDGKTSGDVDASIVTTHMMLEAWEQGIGSTWVMYFNTEPLIKNFNLPENLEPIAILPLGYAADNAKPAPAHTQYRNMDEIVIYK